MKSRPQSRRCNVLSEKLTVWPPLESRSEARTKVTGLTPSSGSGAILTRLPGVWRSRFFLGGYGFAGVVGLVSLISSHRAGESRPAGGPGERHFLEEDCRDQRHDQDQPRAEIDVVQGVRQRQADGSRHHLRQLVQGAGLKDG